MATKPEKVLEALLEKYADQGIENIENIQILTVPPISDFGSVNRNHQSIWAVAKHTIKP